MKNILLVLIVFLPITLSAGLCTQNYDINQEATEENYLLQLDNCDSNPDCASDAYTSYFAESVYNTLAWVGCCGSLGPLFC